MDNLIDTKQDTTKVWIKNRHGIVSSMPKYIADELLADRNRGYEKTDAEFVPKKHIKPFDDEKKSNGQKRANTKKTYTEFDEFIKQSVADLKAYAKENDIDLKGAVRKKDILEAIEKAGKLL